MDSKLSTISPEKQIYTKKWNYLNDIKVLLELSLLEREIKFKLDSYK